MTSRSSPIRASKSSRKASMAAGSARSIPAAQACAVSRQNPTRSARRCRAPRPPRRCRPARRRPCPGRTRSRASSRGRPSRRPGPSSTSARTRASPSASRSVPASHAGAAVRADVDVDEPAQRTRARLAGRWPAPPTERPKKSSSGPARLTRYEAWTATGRMSSSASRARKAGCSVGGSARRRQAVGLSTKIWSAPAPISCARSTALTMPSPEGQVGAEASSIGKHPRMVREAWTCRRHGRSRCRFLRRSPWLAPDGSACGSSPPAGDAPQRPPRNDPRNRRPDR